MIADLLEHYDKVIFFDTETTGLFSSDSQIIELAYIVYARNTYLENDIFISLRPGHSLPSEITNLTGITAATLRAQGIDERKAISTFYGEFSGKVLLVAYNLPFDYDFLKASSAYLNLAIPACDYLDTLALVKAIAPFPHKLKNAITYFDLAGEVENSHRAIGDVKALMAVTRECAKVINLARFITTKVEDRQQSRRF
jgi:DNA polymerase III alpha subunit (gram-positive type)